MKSIRSGWEAIGIITAVVILLVVGIITNGWVLTILWKWFMVPIFHMNPLRIPEALGLSLIAGWFTYVAKKSNKDPDDDIGDIIFKGIVEIITKSIVFLLIGWIVTFFL